MDESSSKCKYSGNFSDREGYNDVLGALRYAKVELIRAGGRESAGDDKGRETARGTVARACKGFIGRNVPVNIFLDSG